jgi:hypothetical protein
MDSPWANDDLDWTVDVDVEAMAAVWLARRQSSEAAMAKSVFPTWPRDRVVEYEAEWLKYTLSQILHGEQLGIIAASRLALSLPSIDAKLMAASQAVDEARHVDFFTRYLETKVGGSYPVPDSMRTLMESVAADPRWDIVFLCGHVMLEGLGLAAFSLLRRTVHEPLLQSALRLIARDEARHIAFGQVSLEDLYAEMSAAELRERQEIAYECASGLIRRFEPSHVWDRFELTPDQVMAMRATRGRALTAVLFSKVIPGCGRLGLLDAGDGWLRERFRELGLLVFDDWQPARS